MTECGTRRAAICLASVSLILLSRQALGHQFLQGRVETVIYRDKITVWASVPIEEVVVQLSLPVNDEGVVATQADAYREHGKYLLKHFFVSADGKPLSGKVASIQEPDNKKFVPGDPSKDYVTYELEYATAAPPGTIALRQNILQEVDFTPGVPWEMTFIAGIRQDQKPGRENLLLDKSIKLTYTCDWSAPPDATPTQSATGVPKAAASANVPPESLKKPLPDSEPQRKRMDFITGIAAGVGIGVMLVFLVARSWKKRLAEK